MITKTSEQLVTKTQLELIMTAWGACIEVPTKNNKCLVVFPGKEHVEITKHRSIGDYKGSMYKIEFFTH